LFSKISTKKSQTK